MMRTVSKSRLLSPLHFWMEPGDRRSGTAGVTSLDLRSIEEQASDPAWTNRADNKEFRFPVPFTKRK